jgi:hypothetical protein
MILDLIKQLVANLALLTSATVLIHLYFKRDVNQLADVQDIHPKLFPFSSKVKLGFLDGIVGSIIMFYGLHLHSGVFIDLRHLPIMLSAFFGGLPSALLAGGIISMSRIFFIDSIDTPALVGSIHTITMAMGCGLISTYVFKDAYEYLLPSFFYNSRPVSH